MKNFNGITLPPGQYIVDGDEMPLKEAYAARPEPVNTPPGAEERAARFEAMRPRFVALHARADRSAPASPIPLTPEQQVRHDAHWASIGPRIAALHGRCGVLPPTQEVIEPIQPTDPENA